MEKEKPIDKSYLEYMAQLDKLRKEFKAVNNVEKESKEQIERPR